MAKRKRKPQTSLRKAIAYIRRTRWIDFSEREAIRLMNTAIIRLDRADVQQQVENLRRTLFRFYFMPEGRMVASITAFTLKAAKAQFYRENPQYKKAKGEIHWEVSL
jgi:hypothetical protein